MSRRKRQSTQEESARLVIVRWRSADIKFVNAFVIFDLVFGHFFRVVLHIAIIFLLAVFYYQADPDCNLRLWVVQNFTNIFFSPISRNTFDIYGVLAINMYAFFGCSLHF